MLSTHKVEVIQVHPEKHPNADTLSVVRAFGYSVVVRTDDWKDGDLGAYVPPDSLVDTARPEFAFLAPQARQDGKVRIRAKKLRGIQSFGLLAKPPAGSKIGDDVAATLGVEHWEPEPQNCSTYANKIQAPEILERLPRYDIDALRRYADVFRTGEPVMVTEKIHGANSRYAFVDGKMYCGSRSEWKEENESCLLWKSLRATPALQKFCETHPNWVVYGECYGAVQNLRYGHHNGEVSFAAFDVLDPDGCYLHAWDARSLLANHDVPMVPLIIGMPFNFETICSLAEGQSLIPGANHIREGCVVKPIQERWHVAIGRVQLKVVGAGYLEKS